MLMTDIPRWEQRLSSYRRALARLGEVVALARTRSLSMLESDGLIQRFKFTHELAWELMKSYAEYQGFSDIAGSRDATRKAFEMGLIGDGQAWMDMIRSRNETSHLYDGEVAGDATARILNEFHPLLVSFLMRMESLSEHTPNDLFAQ